VTRVSFTGPGIQTSGQSFDSRRRNPLQILANLAKLVASAACWILSRTLALVNSALGGNAIRLTFTLRCLQASHAVRYPGLRISELGAPAIEAIVVTNKPGGIAERRNRRNKVAQTDDSGISGTEKLGPRKAHSDTRQRGSLEHFHAFYFLRPHIQVHV
jgi:hypothetical protein